MFKNSVIFLQKSCQPVPRALAETFLLYLWIFANTSRFVRTDGIKITQGDNIPALENIKYHHYKNCTNAKANTITIPFVINA